MIGKNFTVRRSAKHSFGNKEEILRKDDGVLFYIKKFWT